MVITYLLIKYVKEALTFELIDDVSSESEKLERLTMSVQEVKLHVTSFMWTFLYHSLISAF